MSVDEDFTTSVRSALDHLASGAGVEPPDFDSILSHRRRAQRRRVAALSCAVLLIGIGGLAAVASRGDAPIDAAPTIGAAETNLSIPSTTVAPGWFCSGRLGVDDDGRSLFSNCVPGDDEATDWSCDGDLGIDGTGRIRFSDCVAVGQLGPLPDVSTDDPLGPQRDIPTYYTVEAGDFPIGVAEMFCTDVEQLAAANEWTGTEAGLPEWPAPGSTIALPAFDLGCADRTHTVVAGDYPIAIAEQYCVSLSSIFLYNEPTGVLRSLEPGSELLIPPTASTC